MQVFLRRKYDINLSIDAVKNIIVEPPFMKEDSVGLFREQPSKNQFKMLRLIYPTCFNRFTNSIRLHPITRSRLLFYCPNYEKEGEIKKRKIMVVFSKRFDADELLEKKFDKLPFDLMEKVLSFIRLSKNKKTAFVVKFSRVSSLVNQANKIRFQNFDKILYAKFHLKKRGTILPMMEMRKRLGISTLMK